jgi:VWFA-related protein
VEVVQVPVYIRRDAGSVRGLTRDNFDLRVNGKPQQIDYFDVVDFTALSPEQVRDPRQRRLYVLTFDLANASPVSVLRAKRAAEKYLSTAQASDYFAVALLSRDEGIQFIVPFTRDRATLRRAVISFRASAPDDPLRLTVTPSERAAFTNDDGREIADLRRAGGNLAADMAIEAARGRVADEFDDLGDLAKRLAPLEGFKHVVLLSSGFSNALFAVNARPRVDNIRNPQPERIAYLQPPIASGFDSSLPFAQKEMQKKFAAAGVFLDAVDIAGLRPYDAPPNDSLHYVVADTGGEVVEHRNDLAGALQHLTDSQQVVYLLGFHAPATGRKQNAISVHVHGTPRGSAISYRESYSSLAEQPSSSDGLRLADIIINDIPQNGVTMTTAIAAAQKRATVNVTIPGRELLAIADNGTMLTGEALIYIFNGQTAVAFAQKAIDIDIARARAVGLDAGNVEITHVFDLPPGTYAMKVLVRLDGHDTLAFARKEFAIGE